MQQQGEQARIATSESGYSSLSETEKQVGISRVTLRKYLRQLGIEPRGFGVGGRTLYISNDEKERIKRLKANPSLLESLKTHVTE